MGKKETAPNKRSRPSDSPESPGASSADKNITDILESIEKKISSFDARLALVELLHKEFMALRDSLEFSQQQVISLATENEALKGTVQSLTEDVAQLAAENKKIKEGIIDLQARSMRDNLVFSGIPEQAEENTETTIKNFIKQQMKIPAEVVDKMAFHRSHRLGGRRPDGQRPRPIVAKFHDFKAKKLVKSRGRQLKGTDYSVNDQFPKEILDRRRRLFPISKRFMAEGCRAVISVDKLYVNGELYRDREATPWLY
ncbi:uncharacterized protein LOC129603849 [Betta splendens]|uniref:Uncharacterized protein LOC129603849 n=1 Tax=Betta splendens TaxID=158456 RepID=A0A9W2XN96_BETSP|nr:uncharacterized protein LOC129603849 [Betta splendens]